MKRFIIAQTTAILAILILLFGLFYFLSLKPKLELPNALLDAEKTIANVHLNLVQNRIGIMSIVNLDTNNTNVSVDKDKSLNKAIETNKTMLSSLKYPKKIKLVPGEHSSFLNELNNQLPILISENKEIYKKQEGILNTLSKLSDIDRKLFEYNPLSDLGTLDLEENKDEAIERSRNTVNGIETIKNNLSEYDDKNTKQLQILIEDARDLLEKQIAELEEGDFVEASLIFSNIVDNFGKIRGAGLEVELEIIRSDEMVTLLTRQTNLIKQYEYWLKRIDAVQKEISNIDLYSIF